MIRKLIVFFSVVLVLAISIVVIYFIKKQQSDLPTQKKCDFMEQQGIYNSTLSISEVNYQEETDQYNCWCKSQNYNDVFGNGKIADYCQDYATKFTEANLIAFSESVAIFVINFILKFTLKALSKFERTHTVTKQILQMMSKIFLAMYINTALITMIVSAKLPQWMKKAQNEYLDGDYDDFERDWYQTVGNSICITLLINAVMTPLSNFIKWPLTWCKRVCKRGRAITQRELNEIYTGPEFDLYLRYAYILNGIFSTLTFSASMPILPVFMFGSLLLLYWVDKILLLRVMNKPPLYSTIIHERVMNLLPVSVAIHCAFALYQYGAPDIFPSDYNDCQSNYKCADEQSLRERIYTYQGLLYILLGLIAIFILIFNNFIEVIFSCLRSKLKKQVQPFDENQGTYEQGKFQLRENQYGKDWPSQLRYYGQYQIHKHYLEHARLL